MKDFEDSNCGSNGTKGRSGRNAVGDNMLQLGPYNSSWGRGYQKSFARDNTTAPMMQLLLHNYVLKAEDKLHGTWYTYVSTTAC